jgi:hypothetical protein
MRASVSSPSLHCRHLVFAGVKLGVDEEAVLKIINAQFGRLFVCHRAQMPGHLMPRLWAASIAAFNSARVMFM